MGRRLGVTNRDQRDEPRPNGVESESLWPFQAFSFQCPGDGDWSGKDEIMAKAKGRKTSNENRGHMHGGDRSSSSSNRSSSRSSTPNRK